MIARSPKDYVRGDKLQYSRTKLKRSLKYLLLTNYVLIQNTLVFKLTVGFQGDYISPNKSLTRPGKLAVILVNKNTAGIASTALERYIFTITRAGQ